VLTPCSYIEAAARPAHIRELRSTEGPDQGNLPAAADLAGNLDFDPGRSPSPARCRGELSVARSRRNVLPARAKGRSRQETRQRRRSPRHPDNRPTAIPKTRFIHSQAEPMFIPGPARRAGSAASTNAPLPAVSSATDDLKPATSCSIGQSQLGGHRFRFSGARRADPGRRNPGLTLTGDSGTCGTMRAPALPGQRLVIDCRTTSIRWCFTLTSCSPCRPLSRKVSARSSCKLADE